ncbi:MAG: glyoxalase [Bacteroidota bacterium]|jgi:lysozyme family protein
MEREDLVQLRPLIPAATTELSGEAEQFQNAVLRPVIKFQHELLIAHVRNYPNFNTLSKNKGSRQDFHQKVQQFIHKQTDLRNQLIGCVIGLLTLEEFTLYLANKNELNKRITQMVVQRTVDTVY